MEVKILKIINLDEDGNGSFSELREFDTENGEELMVLFKLAPNEVVDHVQVMLKKKE